MKAYHNTAVLKFDDETTGNAASGVPVTIRINNTQALASIFDLDEVATANPLTTDSNGNYAFKANDAIYDIIVSEGTANEVKLEKVEIAEIPTAPILINDLSQAYEFDTVQLMKDSAIVFPVDKPLKTKGYYSVGDGGGAIYNVVAAATGTDDGGSYLDLTGFGQAKLDHNRRTINLLKFGYDATGTNDNDLQVNAAQIFMLETFGGGELLYPVGVGMFGRGIRMDTLSYATGLINPSDKSVKIKHSGASKQGTILKPSTAINNIFTSFPEWGTAIQVGVTTGIDIEINTMTIDMDYDNIVDGGATYGANYATYPTNFPDGSSVPSLHPADNYQYPIYAFLNTGVTVRNCAIKKSWYNGIEIFKSQNIRIFNNDINNCGDKANYLGNYSGIEVDNASGNLHIYSNNLVDVGNGIFSNGGDIANNSNAINDMHIHDNLIENASEVGISAFDWCDNWKVHGNTLKNIEKDAIAFTFVNPSASPNTDRCCQNIQIHNNSIINFGTSNTGTRVGIRFQGHGFSICDNTITNFDPLITQETYAVIVSANGSTLPPNTVDYGLIQGNQIIGTFTGSSSVTAMLNVALPETIVKGNTLHSTQGVAYLAARFAADNITFTDNEIKGTFLNVAGTGEPRPWVQASGSNLLITDTRNQTSVNVKTTSGDNALTGTNKVRFFEHGTVVKDTRGNFNDGLNSFSAEYDGLYRVRAQVNFSNVGTAATPVQVIGRLELNGVTAYGTSVGFSPSRLDLTVLADVPMSAGNTLALVGVCTPSHSLESGCYMIVEYVGPT